LRENIILFLGGWEGTTDVEITFNVGGAIEFGQLVLRTANSSNTEGNLFYFTDC